MCKYLKIVAVWSALFVVLCGVVGATFLRAYIDHVTPSDSEVWWASALSFTTSIALGLVPFLASVVSLALAITTTLHTMSEIE